MKITQSDIDRRHRIRKPKTNSKPRLVIMKCLPYNDRKKFFSNKKLLKVASVSIKESLTVFRMKKLSNARETFGFRNVWAVDGRIFYSENCSQQLRIYHYSYTILTAVVLQKMEILCAVLFVHFHTFYFGGSLRGFFTRIFT